MKFAFMQLCIFSAASQKFIYRFPVDQTDQVLLSTHISLIYSL